MQLAPLHQTVHTLHSAKNMMTNQLLLCRPYLTYPSRPDHALCMRLLPRCWVDLTTLALLAPMTQVGGYQSGFLWDPDTYEPLVRNPAMAHALWLLSQMSQYAVPETECPLPWSTSRLDGGFQHGRCIMSWVGVACHGKV